VAAGKCGAAQLRVTEMLLADLGREGVFRVVMLHHPPHAAGGDATRGLKDHRAFQAMVARVGAELVIHGHDHVSSVDRLAGPNGIGVPVIGAPSASARQGRYRAGYHVYTIDEGPTGFRLEGEARGLRDDGTIGALDRLELAA
jgi:3',5'-cyclic AMP phosphodiesterase CpdA